jgi:hypothetical protein
MDLDTYIFISKSSSRLDKNFLKVMNEAKPVINIQQKRSALPNPCFHSDGKKPPRVKQPFAEEE